MHNSILYVHSPIVRYEGRAIQGRGRQPPTATTRLETEHEHGRAFKSSMTGACRGPSPLQQKHTKHGRRHYKCKCIYAYMYRYIHTLAENNATLVGLSGAHNASSPFRQDGGVRAAPQQRILEVVPQPPIRAAC